MNTVNPKTLRIRGEDSYRRMDGIGTDYELIYKNQLHYTMNVGKLTGLITVPAAFALQLYYYVTGTMPVTEYLTNSKIAFSYSDDVPIMMGVFVIMNILVSCVSHAFTLRIYKKDDK